MEFLKDVLGEALYNQVAEKLKGNDKIKLANLASGEYVGKDKFSAMESAKKDLETQLTDRDKQLETLKKSVGDNETLKAEIAKLQSENSTTKTDYESRLAKTQKDAAIELRLIREGAVNSRAVRALLDDAKITLDGENLVGFDDQLKTIREKESWAFAKPGVPGGGGNPAPNPNNNNPKPAPTGTVAF